MNCSRVLLSVNYFRLVITCQRVIKNIPKEFSKIFLSSFEWNIANNQFGSVSSGFTRARFSGFASMRLPMRELDLQGVSIQVVTLKL